MTHEERRAVIFGVKIRDTRYPDVPGESVLEITHNGYQWDIVSMTKEEAIKIVETISTHFGL